MSLTLNIEHLDVVLRSLRTVYQSIEFESACPTFASWQSAGVLMDLADEGLLSPTDSALCLAVACDLLAFAKHTGPDASSVLDVTISSAVELLGVHQLASQVESQQAEHTMMLNLVMLEVGAVADPLARSMMGALKGLVARSAPIVLWAAASLVRSKEAPLRKWLEASLHQDTAPQVDQVDSAPQHSLRSSDGDVRQSLARARERKVTLIEKKTRSGRRKVMGDDASKKPTLLWSPWKRRAS